MEHFAKRIKILVHGENNLIRKILSPFASVPEKIDFVGGYHPVNCDITIENEEFKTQFLILDYTSDVFSNHLFNLCHGLLVVMEGMNLDHFNKAEKLFGILNQALEKDIFISIVDVVQDTLSEKETFRISEKVTTLIEQVKDKIDTSVSFSLVPDTPQVVRCVKDLIQTSKILTVL
ncbi:MAG: hypothetical protein K9W45_04415 [Candidatus Heimdallarchaeum aukensis]|uniref:Uncharacterized protein n=1 Tax=Candidatus Heimdallarchaeum aukensis TaxID=2876573 RepID=A0A9Y1FMK7_9ARCH|nr:MAG: hypothetical protein K9W45_04415 [Candidatus Heimdallarchaeum aukensis]